MIETATPTRVRVELLHEFRVTVGGSQVALSPGAQLVTAYLALAGRRRPRLAVAGTIWSERTEPDAGACLRRALWHIEHGARGLVERVDHHIGIAPGVDIDLTHLERLADSADDADAGLAFDGADVHLLAGDLLPLWSFDWVDGPREAVRQRRLHALESLARSALAADRPAAALTAALTAVDAEPLRESAQRIVIAVHLAEGNVGEALRQYTSFRDVLWKELRIRPSRHVEDMLPAAARSAVRARPGPRP